MAQRIEVFTTIEDGRAKTFEKRFGKFVSAIKAVRVVDIYTIEADIEDFRDCLASFRNPVSQTAFILNDNAEPSSEYWDAVGSFDHAIEIGFLPGVTDNIGTTATELSQLTLSHNNDNRVYSSQMLLINDFSTGIFFSD